MDVGTNKFETEHRIITLLGEKTIHNHQVI